MKRLINLLFIVLVIFANTFANPDGIIRNTEGYFSYPVVTKYGILASNDLHSSLYLIHEGKAEELLNAPGCGRFLSIDKTGSKVGFKLIDQQNGLQTPAVYDLETREIIKLSEPAKNAGQVSFADDGTIAYTLGNHLYIKKGEIINHYDLGLYSNRTPISPDAAGIIFKDEDDQLWVFDLLTETKYQITSPKMGYGNAVWSPDGGFIAYTSTGTDIFTYDVNKKTTYSIGQGENPQWSSDSKSIVFFRRETDFNKFVLINSDIYISSYDGSKIVNITNTPDINEMDARFAGISNEIIFHTYTSCEIKKLSGDSGLQQILQRKSSLLFKSDKPLNYRVIEVKNTQNNLSKANSSMQWVHIHQVLDTRDSGGWKEERVGYSACGATTALQILASYGILKPWPFVTYGHNSDYGLYDSDVYTFNNITYNNFNHSDWPSGAHGYMWNYGSPYSRIVNFLSNHGISNTTQVDAPSWSIMANELKAGNPYIICSTGLTSAHIVLVTAQYGQSHTVVVDDPYGDKNAGSYGNIYNGGDAIYDWSDGNTGHALITPAAWGVAVRYTPNTAPSVTAYSPVSNVDGIPTIDPIVVDFSHQMDTSSANKAFSIIPYTSGKFTWSKYGMRLTFKPDKPLLKTTKYIITIDTTAKSLWNKPLLSGVTFSFNTRNRDRLNIVQIYPQKDQTDISPSVQFNIVYDSKVTVINGAVIFTDAKGNKVSVANIKLKALDNNRTSLSFEPKLPLAYNESYTLTLPGTFADAEGYTLVDTIAVNFKTERQAQSEGGILDNFETVGMWNSPSFSSSTVGIDTSITKFTISNYRKRSGQTSGKITYSFTQSSGGICRIFDAAKPGVGEDNTAWFGIWVFGDLSNNLLEYWFDDKSGQNKNIFVDTLNWTGWKLKKLYLSQLEGDGSRYFHSIVIKQNPAGNRSGEIYFDDAQLSSITAMEDVIPQIPNEFSISQNYPNPFNPATSINYSIAKQSLVKLSVFNSLGEIVAVVVNSEQPAGNYSVRFNAHNIASGIYFYKIEAGNFIAAKKLLLIK